MRQRYYEAICRDLIAITYGIETAFLQAHKKAGASKTNKRLRKIRAIRKKVQGLKMIKINRKEAGK